MLGSKMLIYNKSPKSVPYISETQGAEYFQNGEFTYHNCIQNIVQKSYGSVKCELQKMLSDVYNHNSHNRFVG